MKLTILLLGLALVAQAANSASNNPPSYAISIRIDAVTNVYKGIPCFVAVTVKNETNEQVTVPQWNPLLGKLPLTVCLLATNGHEYTSSSEWSDFIHGFLGPKPLLSTWNLASGQSVRSIASLGSILAKLNLSAGSYRFSVRLLSEPNQIIGESQMMDINIAEKPTNELSFLNSVSNLTDRAFDLKKNIAFADLQQTKSKDLRETLAFCSLLREVGTVMNAADIRISGYKEFIGTWAQPELEEIEYEVLMAQGNTNQAVLVRDSLLKRYPAMQQWTDRAQTASGFCRSLRAYNAYSP
jgi:hypothetical protein